VKVKIVGFKVGVARPTYNRTVEASLAPDVFAQSEIGHAVVMALRKSDFLSIRKVNGDGETKLMKQRGGR